MEPRRATLGAITLSSPERAQLTTDVATFLHTLLDLEFKSRSHSPSILAGSASNTLGTLIAADGDATFHQTLLSSSESLPLELGSADCLLQQRRFAEMMRGSVERRIRWMLSTASEYAFLLKSLHATFCSSQAKVVESVDLFTIMAGSDAPVTSYFIRLDVDHVNLSSLELGGYIQTTTHFGGFCDSLATLLEPHVERWMAELSTEIERVHPPTSDDDDDCYDVQRIKHLRRKLASQFSKHLAMCGLYVATDPTATELERREPFLNNTYLKALIQEQLDEETKEECERRRDRTRARLLLLRRLIVGKIAVSEIVLQSTIILDLLANPPSILERRPGWASLKVDFSGMRSIIAAASTQPQELIEAQLCGWRKSSPVVQISVLISECINLLNAQALPDQGFMPTLRGLQPPPPPWTCAREAEDSVVQVSPFLPRPTKVDVILELPRGVYRAVRLISCLWELLGFESTQTGFFRPGRVQPRFLDAVIRPEQTSCEFAIMKLRTWSEICSLGRNYRNATHEIAMWRGAKHEQTIRHAFCALSKWSLAEILSVISEDFSPSWTGNLFHVADHLTVRLRQTSSTLRTASPGVVSRLAEMASALVQDMRTDSGLHACLRPHPAGDRLRLVPALRRWRPDGNADLILTVSDVNEGGPLALKAMQELAAERKGVHYGRLSRARAKESGLASKRVFTVNAYDLARFLFGSYD